MCQQDELDCHPLPMKHLVLTPTLMVQEAVAEKNSSWSVRRFGILEDARFTVYEDKRKVIATNVSTCGLQKQSHKSKLRSNEVAKQSIFQGHRYSSTHQCQ